MGISIIHWLVVLTVVALFLGGIVFVIALVARSNRD